MAIQNHFCGRSFVYLQSYFLTMQVCTTFLVLLFSWHHLVIKSIVDTGGTPVQVQIVPPMLGKAAYSTHVLYFLAQFLRAEIYGCNQ